MSNSKFTTVGRKVLMALSGFFLVTFLVMHVSINLVSVFSEDAFNTASHFMGTNPLIQFAMQPILMFGVVFHLGMGIYLELQNNKARTIKYTYNKPGENSSWMSRNMIYTGLVIFAFLGLHLYDFWMHEMMVKYINPVEDLSPTRYYHELVEKFQSPVRVGLYVLAFIALALHLLHGFQSAFQSVGFNNKYTPTIKKLGNIFAILVPGLFIFISIALYLKH